MQSRVLVYGYGNPGRQDDGLGPALVHALGEMKLPSEVTLDANYQLMVEDASAVAEHAVVVLVDAAISGPAPFLFSRVQPAPTLSFSSHSLSAGALVGLAQDVMGAVGDVYAVGIRGYEFGEFGEGLSPGAANNLRAAVCFVHAFVRAQVKLNGGRSGYGVDGMRSGKHVILYIDDDQDMLDSLRVAVEGAGYEMETATSAEEGLRAFKEHAPDLIIVDLMMEEVDSGTELVKDLKLAGNQAPVYLLSSVGDQLNMTTDYAALGLVGIFQKPLEINTLLVALETKLRS